MGRSAAVSHRLGRACIPVADHLGRGRTVYHKYEILSYLTTMRKAGQGHQQRERLLWVLSAATSFISFQAYMVAPLIPRLAAVFGVSSRA